MRPGPSYAGYVGGTGQGTVDWCNGVIESFRGPLGRVPEEIASLAKRLASSGVVVQPEIPLTDVVSTGGPASLTTMLAPLYLVASGFSVGKVGVPGRPAGVIDTFGVIPGYKVDLDQTEFLEVIRQSGFANTRARATFAPDDGLLFAARQQYGAQNIPGLVIASLLAKKISAGVSRVAVDIRAMPGGNFGTTRTEAEENGQLLLRTAALLNIEATYEISDSQVVAQPMIGRSEALTAVAKISEGTEKPWLSDHSEKCLRLASLAAGKDLVMPAPRALQVALDRHLRAQGAGGLPALTQYLEATSKMNSTATLRAQFAGRLEWNLAGIRTAIVNHQSLSVQTTNSAYDDGCGMELLRQTGDVVKPNESIAVVRGVTNSTVELVIRDLQRLQPFALEGVPSKWS